MTLTTPQRDAIVQVADLFIANASPITYPAPDQVIRPHVYRTVDWLQGYWKTGHHSVWDCSIAVQQVLYCAGNNGQTIADPSGFEYEGWGDTQSWQDALPHYTSPVDAHAGALVVFNAGGPVEEQHGCIVITPGSDPVLFSHGSAAGPLRISLSEEQTAHTGSTVFLDVSSL
jgi:hypothetical protein